VEESAERGEEEGVCEQLLPYESKLGGVNASGVIVGRFHWLLRSKDNKGSDCVLGKEGVEDGDFLVFQGADVGVTAALQGVDLDVFT
jgi:hypothetical protein